jgi:hypothetical protein
MYELHSCFETRFRWCKNNLSYRPDRDEKEERTDGPVYCGLRGGIYDAEVRI